MAGMNERIADNITNILQESGKNQSELAEALNVSKQDVGKMLSGGEVINAVKLSQIADFLHVSIEEFTAIHDVEPENDVIQAFMEEVNSESAKKALEVVDELADLVIFHARVRENAEEMMKPWRIE